jgi:myo-inositol catabolism protein IolC
MSDEEAVAEMSTRFRRLCEAWDRAADEAKRAA